MSELGPGMDIDLALIEMTVSAETVLDALAIAVRGLGDVARAAARSDPPRFDLAEQAMAALDEAVALVRPLVREYRDGG